MFVASSDFDSLIAKGVASKLAERDEGGFFTNVVSIHPFAKKTRVIEISKQHQLYEFGFDQIPGCSRFRSLRLSLSPFLLALAAIRIRRLVISRKISVVRASDPYWAAISAWLGTRFTSTVFLVSIHADWDKRHQLDPRQGAPKLLGSRRVAVYMQQFLLRRADGILCIRESLRQKVIESGLPASKVRLIRHGVDLSFARLPQIPALGEQAERHNIVFAGRVSKENYVDDIVEIARLLQDRPDLKFVVLGDGPELPRLRNLVASSASLTSRIMLKGFVDQAEVRLQQASSLVNFVPMGGYSLIEASASGRPVITYDVEWHSELVDDGVSGFLVKESDLNRVRSLIMMLSQDAVTASAIGTLGRQRAIELHDFDKIQPHRIDAYRAFLP
jgi:glycosyltransferase involved in cell wall biosynthesis